MDTTLAPLTTMVPALEADASPATALRHPVAAYLAGLAPSSRTTQRRACEAMARLATDGRHGLETFPWAALDFDATRALRERVALAYAPSTANRLLAALRGVLKAAWRLRLMDGDQYARAADLPDVRGHRLPRGRMLEAGEVSALFATCADGTPVAARDAALLALAYACGLRRAELVGLDLTDYDATTGELRVRGKGQKDRRAFLVNGARAAVEAWLAVRGTAPGALLSRVGKGGRVRLERLTPQAVLVILRRRADAAGVAACSPHDCRRTFVSMLLEQGADIATVARLAGHADVRTTQRYDRRPDAMARRAVETLHVPYRPAS